MWTISESDARALGGLVQLTFRTADHAAAQRAADELGGSLVRGRTLETAAGSDAVLRLAKLQAAYRVADAGRQRAEAALDRLTAERAAAAAECGPELAARLVELDRQADAAQAGAGQGVARLEPLLQAAYAGALGEVRAMQAREGARATAEATAARAEALARLAALPAVQQALGLLAACSLFQFSASSGQPLGGSAEGLLAQALQQAAAAAAEGTGEPEPAEAEATPAPVPVG